VRGFWSPGGPRFVVAVEGPAAPALAIPPTGSVAVVRLSGAALQDDDGVFLALSEGFRFPEYFGWNWDALSDCLRDLAWYPADSYLVVIDDADRMLANDDESRTAFLSVLGRAAKSWADPLTSRRNGAIAFKVVLIAPESGVESLLRQVADASVERSDTAARPLVER
jgi:RNAse (barnase) inhibitor barstar